MQPSRLQNDPWAATAHKMCEIEANVRGGSGGTSNGLVPPQPVMKPGPRFPVAVHEVKKEVDEDDMLEEPSPPDLAQPASTKFYRGGSLYLRQDNGVHEVREEKKGRGKSRIDEVSLSLPPASGSSGFICVECGRSCPNRDSIRKHVARVHEKRYVDSARKTYPCERPGCDKVLKTLRALRDHHNGHDGIRAYECGTCAKTFIARAELAKHLNVHHKTSIKAVVAVEGFLSAQTKEDGEEEAACSSTTFDEKRSSNSTSNELPPLFSNDVQVKMEPFEENREYIPPSNAMSSSFSYEVGEKVELQQPQSSRWNLRKRKRVNYGAPSDKELPSSSVSAPYTRLVVIPENGSRAAAEIETSRPVHPPSQTLSSVISSAKSTSKQIDWQPLYESISMHPDARQCAVCNEFTLDYGILPGDRLKREMLIARLAASENSTVDFQSNIWNMWKNSFAVFFCSEHLAPQTADAISKGIALLNKRSWANQLPAIHRQEQTGLQPSKRDAPT